MGLVGGGFAVEGYYEDFAELEELYFYVAFCLFFAFVA